MSLDIFHQAGLNISSSIKVSALPEEMIQFLIENKIDHDLKKDTLWLIGSGGSDLWKQLPHPLNIDDDSIDTFCLKQIKSFDLNARLLFPHPDWHFPLQKLGRILNISRPSLMGQDISEEYGLWFAFRGAFLTQKQVTETKYLPFLSACETCLDHSCLSNCHAEAISLNELNLFKCIDYRLGPLSKCADRCHARASCPYQSEHAYTLEQIQYHMGNRHHLKKLLEFLELGA